MMQSLRHRITEMAVGQVIAVEPGQYKANTVYNYASFIGREYGRVYSTRYDRGTRIITVTRES